MQCRRETVTIWSFWSFYQLWPVLPLFHHRD